MLQSCRLGDGLFDKRAWFKAPGQPFPTKKTALKKMIFDNRQITMREVADDVGRMLAHAKQFLRMG